MNSFIQLKIAGENDSTYKRLRVVFGTGSYPHSTEQGRVLNRTTTGRLSKQIGPAYKYWYGSFRVKMREDTGYATLDDLYKWMTSETPTDHRLVMRPWKWLDNINEVAIKEPGGTHLYWWPYPTYALQTGQIITRTDTLTTTVITSVINSHEADIEPMDDDSSFLPDEYVWHPVRVTGIGITCDATENVAFVTGVDPQPQVPVMESSGGFAIVPFRLEAR